MSIFTITNEVGNVCSNHRILGMITKQHDDIQGTWETNKNLKIARKTLVQES
jgi:hypothetical protein